MPLTRPPPPQSSPAEAAHAATASGRRWLLLPAGTSVWRNCTGPPLPLPRPPSSPVAADAAGRAHPGGHRPALRRRGCCAREQMDTRRHRRSRAACSCDGPALPRLLIARRRHCLLLSWHGSAAETIFGVGEPLRAAHLSLCLPSRAVLRLCRPFSWRMPMFFTMSVVFLWHKRLPGGFHCRLVMSVTWP